MYTHHKFDQEFPPGTSPKVFYWVCSTPRSGSSLLCELLCLTGLAGAPTEYFDREQMHGFARAWGTHGFDSYLQALIDKKTSPNGVFGAKIHWGQMLDLFTERDLHHVLPRPRYLWITRTDRIRQSVSWARANQTGQWASTHAARSGRELSFDYHRIEALRQEIEAGDAGWQDFFAGRSISPLRIVYEDLIHDQSAVLENVLDFLGVARPPDFSCPSPTLCKQADRRSERWVRRYQRIARRRALAAGGFFGQLSHRIGRWWP